MIRLSFWLIAVVPLSGAADITLKQGNLAEALEQARKAPKPVRIVVEDGVHPITETITLVVQTIKAAG